MVAPFHKDKGEQPGSLQFHPLPLTTEKQRKPLSKIAVDTAGWLVNDRRSRPRLGEGYRMVVGQAPCRLGGSPGASVVVSGSILRSRCLVPEVTEGDCRGGAEQGPQEPSHLHDSVEEEQIHPPPTGRCC